MDNAVALVQAYLQMNGYFTVTEFPIVEYEHHDHFNTATDIDMLAFRFPNAGIIVSKKDKPTKFDQSIIVTDTTLALTPNHSDMIIAEVKEGKGRFNENMFNPEVLRTTLVRFGCCPMEEAASVSEKLVEDGHLQMRHDHQVRLVVFAKDGIDIPTKYKFISMEHVVTSLEQYITEHWEMMHTIQLKDHAFSFLMTIAKAKNKQK